MKKAIFTCFFLTCLALSGVAQAAHHEQPTSKMQLHFPEGVSVVDVGEVPTPVLYHAAKVRNLGAGVMVTGSHNPIGGRARARALDATPSAPRNEGGSFVEAPALIEPLCSPDGRRYPVGPPLSFIDPFQFSICRAAASRPPRPNATATATATAPRSRVNAIVMM